MHRALALGRGFLWTRRSSNPSQSSGGLSCCSWPLPSLFRPAAREEETGAPGGAHPARRYSLRVRPKLWCQGQGGREKFRETTGGRAAPERGPRPAGGAPAPTRRTAAAATENRAAEAEVQAPRCP